MHAACNLILKKRVRLVVDQEARQENLSISSNKINSQEANMYIENEDAEQCSCKASEKETQNSGTWDIPWPVAARHDPTAIFQPCVLGFVGRVAWDSRK